MSGINFSIQDLEPRDPKEPKFEDPIVLAVINGAGEYYIFDILNSDKICADFWDDEIHILNYDAVSSHPDLTNAVVQMRLKHNSWSTWGDYGEEWDGETEFVDEKILWKYPKNYDSDTLMHGTQPSEDNETRAILKDSV